MKKEIYIIVKARIEHFEEFVNDAIKNGYLPIGGVSVSTIDGGHPTFCQAMIRSDYAK